MTAERVRLGRLSHALDPDAPWPTHMAPEVSILTNRLAKKGSYWQISAGLHKHRLRYLPHPTGHETRNSAAKEENALFAIVSAAPTHAWLLASEAAREQLGTDAFALVLQQVRTRWES